jgi:hypothetical protein
VVLTERTDSGWKATLDGRSLASLVTSGWAQCFELPASGGRLHLYHDGDLVETVRGVQVGVLAFALLGLLPLPRLRSRLAVPTPPDPSHPVPRTVDAGPALDQLPPMPRVFDADHPEDGEVAPLFSDDLVPASLGSRPGTGSGEVIPVAGEVPVQEVMGATNDPDDDDHGFAGADM